MSLGFILYAAIALSVFCVSILACIISTEEEPPLTLAFFVGLFSIVWPLFGLCFLLYGVVVVVTKTIFYLYRLGRKNETI